MMSNPVERPVRVGLISLGCAKNLVDAEIMLGSLLKHGVEITNDAANADALIVNTCSFIDAAQEESVDTILQSAQLRDAQNRGQGLIVSGCLPQRFREELPKLLPEVDAFMGIDQVAQVTEIVHKALHRRRERLAQGKNPKSKVQSPKSKIMGRFAELEQANSSDEPGNRQLHQAENGSQGPAIHHPSSSLPPSAPMVEVHSRPNYI